MNIELVIEIAGAVISLLYMWLQMKQRSSMWVVGFISAAFYVIVFYHGKFYADMGTQIYYMAASIYGFLLWRRRAADAGITPLSIAHTPCRTAIWLSLIAILLFAALAALLIKFTDSPVPRGDALTTALSIVAMWMLAHKLLEQWLVWIVVNIVSVFLYYQRGLMPTAVLYAVYSMASVIGYYQWKRQIKNGQCGRK